MIVVKLILYSIGFVFLIIAIGLALTLSRNYFGI